MEQENNFRSGFVTLIGRPNVGKSTLMNHLIGQKIAITSAKPQTTRNKIMTVYTDDECQMVFLDTPGINDPKNKLGDYMTKAAKSTISEVDVVLYLVEPSSFIGDLELSIIEELKSVKKPVILVINKMDTVDEGSLKKFEDAFRARMDFAEVVYVSALKGKNVDDLLEVIRKFLPIGPPYYDEETITDQPERQIVAEIIREKALRLMRDEVPHGIAVTVEKMRMRERALEAVDKPKKKRHQHPPKKSKAEGQQESLQESLPENSGFEEDGPVILTSEIQESLEDNYEYGYDPNGIMDIEAIIICERDSHKGIIIGKGGSMLKKIGSAARKDIEEMLSCRVNLQIFVKVRNNWRDDNLQLKNFGYDYKKL